MVVNFRSKLPLKKKVALRTRAYRNKKDYKSSPSHSANKKRVSHENFNRYLFLYKVNNVKDVT